MHDEHPGDTSAGPAETAAETVGNGGGIERKSASADPFGRRRSIFLKFLGIGIVLGLPLVGLTFLLMLDTESGTGLIPCQGKIRYYEKSVSGGYVQTKWLEGTKTAVGSHGQLDAQGRFTLTTNGQPGAPVGEHRIAVMVFSDDEERRPLVPKHYTSVDTTPLMINVQPHRTGQPNVFTLFITNDPPVIAPQVEAATP